MSAGADLKQSILDDLTASNMELDPAESALLDRAADAMDIIESLEDWISENGAIGTDGKVAPAVVEARLQKTLLASLLGRLEMSGKSAASMHGTKASNIRWHGNAKGVANA